MPVYSMTGYGQARTQTPLGEFAVQLKSVNNRFADVQVRMPREFNALEIPLRDRVKNALLRGKIDVAIQWSPSEQAARTVKLDKEIINSLREQIMEMQREWGAESDVPWRDLLGLPGAASIEQPEIDLETAREMLEQAVDAALKPMLESRANEGNALKEHLLAEICELITMTETVETVRGEVVEQYREKLMKRLEELMQRAPDAIDDSRIEAEVLIMAERCDITEELVRLRSHFQAFNNELTGDTTDEVGKGLEFLTQELNREVNTIGSKARLTSVNSTVVEMKKIIEKIREQLANIV